jgi:glycosyltransferase involved in cell wall biosynthesis
LISIIIPTRNRPELLKNLIDVISEYQLDKLEIIVVDSSDPDKQSKYLASRASVKYIVTPIRSAAIQRNIGIENLGNSRFVFFLDDDVIPEADYFDRCVSHLSMSGVVGISGVARNPTKIEQRVKPSGLVGIFQTFFLLDSKEEGVLLKSGINIPVRGQDGQAREVEWLIGCSAWNRDSIGDIRFEIDFVGQSLGEDVIFSTKMKRRGRLITDPNIVLLHSESEIERPPANDFWTMWVVNRKRLVQVAGFGLVGKLCFWWANFGQFLILIYGATRRSNAGWGGPKGLLIGAFKAIAGKS